MYRSFIKRGIDAVGALLGLVLLGWLLLLLAVLVRIKLGAPVIFRQQRPGKNERIFTLYKFRSMSDARDGEGKLLPDAQRLTRFGRLLRATSLDELPELWNILKGDMSFVGPRPWTVRYLQFYTPEEHRRHLVRPGLTGYAQVNGRTAADWGERLKMDVYYVDHLSFVLDARVFFKTFAKVFARGEVVAAEAQGNFDEYRRRQWENGEVPMPEEIP